MDTQQSELFHFFTEEQAQALIYPLIQQQVAEQSAGYQERLTHCNQSIASGMDGSYAASYVNSPAAAMTPYHVEQHDNHFGAPNHDHASANDHEGSCEPR